jgi:transcriptional regulator with XRE-family HTH domain
LATDIFDAGGFYSALDAVRITRRMTWKDVATATGISASTLTRMAQGRRPDVDSLAVLANWANLSTDDFMGFQEDNKQNVHETLAAVSAQFRKDKKLNADAKKAIEVTLFALYRQLAKDDLP